MPRPRKQQHENRTSRMNLRLSPTEREEVESKARLAGLPAHEFARVAALGCRVVAAAQIATPDPTAPTTPLVVALNRVGVNLNQIARALNAQTGIQPQDLVDTLARVNALLDTWQEIKTP